VSAPAVTIYLSEWCPYCQRARDLLARKKVEVKELNVEDDPKLREQMVSLSRRGTVPQIFIGERHVGGCDELFELERSGELDRLLQGA
jgi:glutaredoxin 3